MTALLANWRLIGFALLLAVIAALAWQIDRRTDQRDAARAGWAQEMAAHAGTIANVRAAAEQARAADAANKARVEAEQRAVTAKLEKDHEASTAALDARYRRLLASASAATAARGAGTTPVSGEPDATCLAYAGARCDELPARMKAAQANTEQLLGWQAWWRGIAEIDR